MKVTLHFLEPNLEFSLPEPLLARASCEQAIDQAMRDIALSHEPSDFPVRPEVHCRMCNFREICYAGREFLRSAGMSGA